MRMLVAGSAERALTKDDTLQDGLDLVWAHPQVRTELVELLPVLERGVDHVHADLPGHPDVPLQIHARYSRLEILAAMGVGAGAKIAAWQTGVYEAKDAKAELLAFTFDKSSGGFSPTTRYRDYAISRTLIHWESQAITRADSPTGLRYRHHEREGRAILLFSRLRADDRAFWFLGPATYRGHVGEKPWPSPGSSRTPARRPLRIVRGSCRMRSQAHSRPREPHQSEASGFAQLQHTQTHEAILELLPHLEDGRH